MLELWSKKEELWFHDGMVIVASIVRKRLK